MEGNLIGLAHLDRLLEKAAPRVDRAAAKQRLPGEHQDVGVDRGITAPLGVLDRFLDVGGHLLAGRAPRHGPRPGPNAQPEGERSADVGGA